MNKNKSYNYKFLLSLGLFAEKQRDTFNFLLNSEKVQLLFKEYCSSCHKNATSNRPQVVGSVKP